MKLSSVTAGMLSCLLFLYSSLFFFCFCCFFSSANPLSTYTRLDPNSDRAVPQPGAGVWRHQSDHNGGKPGSRQYRQRSVWEPDLRVLQVRLCPDRWMWMTLKSVETDGRGTTAE